MPANRSRRRILKILFWGVFTLAYVLILRNFYLLSRDLLLGDGSAERLLPATRYGLERIPDTPATRQVNAQNRLAVDFAQIYFPARQMESLNQNYQSGALDPLQRPSRYAPMIHFLCSISVCRLDYGFASLLHMLIQLVLFYILFVYSFWVLKIKAKLLPAILLLDICLFLTPAGLSWFERGQFSLYTGAAILMMLLGLIKQNKFLVLASAVPAFIKWTSFPTLLVILGAVVFSGRDVRAGWKTFLLALGFLGILIALCLPFPTQMVDFLKGLYTQERFALPGGISLTKILPVALAKLLPLPLILLGVIHLRMNHHSLEQAVPFFAGAAVLMLTYPTLAYEYNLPSVLGALPLLFFWSRPSADPVPSGVRAGMKYAFFAFLLLASFANYLQGKWIEMGEYALICALLLLVPLFFYWRGLRKPAAEAIPRRQ